MNDPRIRNYLKGEPKRGSALLGECPEGGYVWLTHKVVTYCVVTRCKTWSCRSCRERVRAVVLARAEVGMNRLGRCYLITLTLRLSEGSEPRDAAYVGKVWRRCLRRIRDTQPTLSWFRVVELTKRGQPHLHLVVGGIGMRTDSCGRPDRTECPVSCVEHQWRSLWIEATEGDSFIVDCMEVWTAHKAASYLGKYLGKEMFTDRLRDAGFTRRWSRSRNWPSGAVHLAGTEVGWNRVGFSRKGDTDEPKAAYIAETLKDAPLLKRVGDDLMIALAEKRERLKLAGPLEAFLKGATR